MTEQQLPEVVFARGPRVVLRPIEKSDAARMTIWLNDPEVTQYLTSHTPLTQREEEEWIDGLQKTKHHQIVVAISVDGTYIGNMGIHRINWRSRTAITGAVIGEKEYWGKGYGQEAKMLLLNYAFNTLGLRKISSDVIAFNERSIKYSLGCGYKEEARLKAQHFRNGEYWDEVILSVFREDWLPLWEAFVQKNNLKAR